jgi:hypothetical protein
MTRDRAGREIARIEAAIENAMIKIAKIRQDPEYEGNTYEEISDINGYIRAMQVGLKRAYACL